MRTKKILFICGSLNQTTIMHKISQHLNDYEHYFTPFFADGLVRLLAEKGLLNFSILGGQFRRKTEKYLKENNLRIDYRGGFDFYDLVFTCTDLIIQKNIKNKKVILVQEGMTNRENILFYLTKYLNLPRYFAGTSTTGLSNQYVMFCVASEGYKNLFIKKGADPGKIIVTGIPNFDNCAPYSINNFPYRNFVLAATSDTRETFRYENRKKFIEKAVRIAQGRQIIFKLHPNEIYRRAAKEINKYAPGALVFQEGDTNHMIANCDVLVTKYSSVVYVGLALGKEVYSDFNLDELKNLLPIQNAGTSAANIARVGEELLNEDLHIFHLKKPSSSKIIRVLKSKLMKATL